MTHLCRYWRPALGPTLGVVVEGRVYDLAAVDPGLFGSFTAVISSADPDQRLGAAQARLGSLAGIPYAALDVAPDRSVPHLLAPVTKQEVWAAGVTYLRSRDARMSESETGGSFYDRVYAAERPELFFKATPNRVAGPNEPIRIRGDSRWNVPEPELALVVNRLGRIVAFTIGNDVSSRDIEGENPLYLPQAKVYMRSCALGPALLLAGAVDDPRAFGIELVIRRGGAVAFSGSTSIARMKRGLEELVAYLCREQEFPNGAILLTGTGIVPPDDFTLAHGDVVEITIPGIGTLRNPVA
jgi:2-dehydro-3-deoxy-D-arabinonate dehydratase